MKRVILMVLDSLGVGALPDAAEYNDQGANTFANIVKNTADFNIPNLTSLGLCNINDVDVCEGVDVATGCYGKLGELSKGKDTITGHYELVGLETKDPFKTYSDGFPKEFMEPFQKAIGIECIGNYPTSGTVIIDALGEEHEKTGKPIVYTSADSVFQIAANVDVIPLERLYEICKIAREMLVGEFACGRVIARPYKLVDGKRTRTADRHDYAISPPANTALDNIKNANKEVYAVGKIKDIFNGQGITKSVVTKSNMDGVDKTIQAIKEDFEGLIFTNLVEFDSEYGHRRDPKGYGKAIMDFDKRIPEIIEQMKEEDILMLCADHGNDPTHAGYDHTREYVPIITYSKNTKNNINIGTRSSFADVGATICHYLDVDTTIIGKSFLDLIK